MEAIFLQTHTYQYTYFSVHTLRILIRFIFFVSPDIDPDDISSDNQGFTVFETWKRNDKNIDATCDYSKRKGLKNPLINRTTSFVHTNGEISKISKDHETILLKNRVHIFQIVQQKQFIIIHLENVTVFMHETSRPIN